MTTKTTYRCNSAAQSMESPVEKVAREFCRAVQISMPPEEIAEMIEDDSGPNDYYDANMDMDSAFSAAGETLWSASGEIDELTCDLWNAAWSLAAENNYSMGA